MGKIMSLRSKVVDGEDKVVILLFFGIWRRKSKMILNLITRPELVSTLILYWSYLGTSACFLLLLPQVILQVYVD